MATVHLGRLLGPGGFGRTVAIKRLHPQYAKDPEFVAMFLDEARLAARVQHPNVVPTIDIVALEGELFLVMEHVHGESLSRLLQASIRVKEPVPLPIASAILSGALHGLHAAHETKDERGNVLGIVHRDVSPQNILVSVNGVARVLDFGVAKAAGRLHTTQEGQVKGKLAYMAPEQLRRDDLDRTADLYALAVVLWETVTLERLFKGDNEAQVVAKVLAGRIPPISELVPNVPPELDAVAARGLDRDPTKRFATGREMASALEQAVRPATPTEVAAWVAHLSSESLRKRSAQMAEVEIVSDVSSSGAAQAKMFLAELASGPDPLAPEEEAKSTKSEMSHVSMAAATEPPPAPRSRRGAWYVVGAVALGGVALAATRSTWQAPTAAATSGSAPAAVAAAPSPPDPTVAAPTATATPTATPTPTDAATGAPSTVVRVPAAKHPPRLQPVASPPQSTSASPLAAPHPAKDCDPPYAIDSAGEKHYKKECF
jgi:serine/threonine-protein kinase